MLDQQSKHNEGDQPFAWQAKEQDCPAREDRW